MPRIARLIVKEEEAVYHVMSRTALDGYVMGDVEKDFLLDVQRRGSVPIPDPVLYRQRNYRYKRVCFAVLPGIQG